MEIRDPVHGSIEITPQEVAVIDSPAFQRLRTIKQLGFGEYSYPGATHNRYIHSIGVFHLAGIAYDTIFQGFPFVNKEAKWRFRQAVKLAALLHDIGHGPLSHSTEEVMPNISELDLPIFRGVEKHKSRRAGHEDYTLKFITDSPLTKILRDNFADIDPVHIACLIESSIACPDDFFIDNGINFRPLLSQLVSSELDCDRMDYLLRDSYFCGTDYGRIELKWLISNLTFHIQNGSANLAISRRAVYTFDDFLISRHHMYLMVYFHHKCIIYDEMLHRYLLSNECDYRIPADINRYLDFNDHHLYEHLRKANSPWAQRISNRRPFRMLFELHETKENPLVTQIEDKLKEENIHIIRSSSVARLSKYHTSLTLGSSYQIFVVDLLNPKIKKPDPLERSTDIFQMYEKSRRVERIYVAPEDYNQGLKIISELGF